MNMFKKTLTSVKTALKHEYLTLKFFLCTKHLECMLNHAKWNITIDEPEDLVYWFGEDVTQGVIQDLVCEDFYQREQRRVEHSLFGLIPLMKSKNVYNYEPLDREGGNHRVEGMIKIGNLTFEYEYQDGNWIGTKFDYFELVNSL